MEEELCWGYSGQNCTSEKTEVIWKGAGGLDQHAEEPSTGRELVGPGVSRVEIFVLGWKQQPKKAFSSLAALISVFCLPSDFGISSSK